MATITWGGGVFTTTAGNKTTLFTPAVDDLIVVITGTSGVAGGTTAVTDNNSSGTYTKVFGTDWTSGVNTDRLNMWVRTALIPAASSTTFTATQASSSGGGLMVARIAGMTLTGASAIKSSGGQSNGTAATTPAPVLSVAPFTDHPIFLAVMNGTSPAGITPRTSFTEDAVTGDLGYSVPTMGMEGCFRNSGETSATQTLGSTSASAFASAALELDISRPIPNLIMAPQWQ